MSREGLGHTPGHDSVIAAFGRCAGRCPAPRSRARGGRPSGRCGSRRSTDPARPTHGRASVGPHGRAGPREEGVNPGPVPRGQNYGVERPAGAVGEHRPVGREAFNAGPDLNASPPDQVEGADVDQRDVPPRRDLGHRPSGRARQAEACRIEFPGWDPTTSSLIAEVELAEEPEWGIRRDALGIHSLSRMGDGGPVRHCDIL